MLSSAAQTISTNSTATAAIRSLNADFVRKGIVINADDGSGASRGLDPKIWKLVDALKGSVTATGSRDLHDLTSAIQLWKERSLHHTLQTLDQATKGSDNATHDRQIEAIELHDRAGREIKEAVMRVVQNIINAIVQQIDGFSLELASVIRELIRPELEEELFKERGINERLILERQKLIKEEATLQELNTQLSQRIDNWEHADDGGGDATLCRKLREQVGLLKHQQQDMEQTMTQMQKDHEQWRFEMAKMKTDLEMAYKTIAMTQAMHEKESKQLVELIHAKESQFDCVRLATASAKAASTGKHSMIPLITSHDSNSGRTICYVNAQSPRKSSRPVLACLPPQQPPVKSPSKPPVGSSPQKRRLVASAPSAMVYQ